MSLVVVRCHASRAAQMWMTHPKKPTGHEPRQDHEGEEVDGPPWPPGEELARAREDEGECSRHHRRYAAP